MAFIHLYLNIDAEYIQLLRDIYKIVTILVVFQLILHFGEAEQNMIHRAFTGKILNNDFFILLFILLISISSYYLVFAKLLMVD